MKTKLKILCVCCWVGNKCTLVIAQGFRFPDPKLNDSSVSVDTPSPYQRHPPRCLSNGTLAEHRHHLILHLLLLLDRGHSCQVGRSTSVAKSCTGSRAAESATDGLNLWRAEEVVHGALEDVAKAGHLRVLVNRSQGRLAERLFVGTVVHATTVVVAVLEGAHADGVRSAEGALVIMLARGRGGQRRVDQVRVVGVVSRPVGGPVAGAEGAGSEATSSSSSSSGMNSTIKSALSRANVNGRVGRRVAAGGRAGPLGVDGHRAAESEARVGRGGVDVVDVGGSKVKGALAAKAARREGLAADAALCNVFGLRRATTDPNGVRLVTGIHFEVSSSNSFLGIIQKWKRFKWTAR